MAASSSRRGVLIGLGALAVIAGLVAAVALWNIGGDRRRDAVENFARAPVGCDTTLDFVETGTFLVFVETSGRVDGIRGDCDVSGTYDVRNGRPDVDLTVLDPEGDPVDVERSSADVGYDEDGFVGQARYSIDIGATDDHVFRVESSDDDVFVVAVGRDPNAGVAALRGGAAAAGIVGLVIGLVLILLGARPARATVVAVPWNPAGPGFVPGQVPQGPPVYGNQVGPPQFPVPYTDPPHQSGPPLGQQPQFGVAQQPPPEQFRQPPSPPQHPPPQHPRAVQSAPYARPPSDPYGVPQPSDQVPPPPPSPPIAPQPSFGDDVPAWGSGTAWSDEQSGNGVRSPVPHDPAGRVQPIEWAPQSLDDDTSVPLDTAPPDADFIARLRAERADDADTDRRPPPPPPD